ncbi:hypothetical protein CDL12_07660 [Handroanthus impetiginosus]|uniref:NB-ARC domain-containing protein n=1 Tax=Handroanthus impetiginosus TaxID=429701 RepID=A0A2G9HQU2_9LAMI|nr:hypothetical protein CDL12_07660 [Handroanthus impetiginosus]
MEEIAERYMDELLNRSLIQVVNNEGQPRYFHIHDLVRKYSISKAREQNIAAAGGQGKIPWPDNIRRLALYGFSNPPEKISKCTDLRSLLFFGPGDSKWGSILYEVMRGGCRMLKVLELRGAPIDAIPAEVFKLYLLKYLGLRDTPVKSIPKSIGNLGKLETLDLKNCRVTELPIEIIKLQLLRNLLLCSYVCDHGYFEGVQGFNAPYEMGRLAGLQKLCFIALPDAEGGRKEAVREIGKLTQLQRLGITKLRREDGTELYSSLDKLTNLRSLNIVSFEKGEFIDLEHLLPPSTLPLLRTLKLQGRLERIPKWADSLNALTTLNLRGSRFREDPLEHIQGLPNLLLLSLDCDSYEGRKLSFKAGGFQRLHKLSFVRLGELRWVTVEKGSMPLLHDVVVSGCKLMQDMPMGIEYLKNLKLVDFTDMEEEFVERLKNEKRKKGDQWRLAHVPEVVVYNWVNGERKRLPL